MKTIIRNGTAVFEHSVEQADILVDSGRIAGILAPGAEAAADETIDAAGLHIFPGSIDPHTHWGIYKDYRDDVAEDSKRAVIGGLTTVLQFHRSNDDYFESVPRAIALCDRESMVDYCFSLGLVKKSHCENLERYAKELGTISFKFYLDKTDLLEKHYGLTPGTGLRGNKKEILDILKKLKTFSSKATLCVHCEDTEIFYPIQQEVFASAADQHSLAAYSAARPGFGETSAILSAIWVNSVAEGNLYIVHTSTGDGVDAIRRLKPMLKGRLGVETCPHYLALDVDSPCGLNGTVVPPIREKRDSEMLWQGIEDGTVTAIGTDNCPGDLIHKYRKGKDIRNIIPGFPSAGMMLPVLIEEGYFKRGIPLWKLSQVNSVNAARQFGLERKGELKVGFDADFALVDLDWKRTIGPELYGHCDYSIYDGMSFRGWPRLTMLRGAVVQKDGKIAAPPSGKFIMRTM